MFGIVGGYTHSFVTMGQPTYFFGGNTVVKNSSGAPSVYDSSGNPVKVGNSGSGGFIGVYDFGPGIGKYDYGKQQWVTPPAPSKTK